MHTIEVDVAVIGAGTAGMAAYRAARAHGKRTLLIEGGPYGTTCARVGCMPSKLLIAAAEAAHALAAAPGFGVHPGSVRIDGRAVMARLQSERDRFIGFALATIDAMPAEDKIRGCARFTGPRRLQIGQHTCIDAGSIVIAVGGAPVVPEEWRTAGARVVTSDDIFDWDDLPQSVAVAGSGALGLELGQALHRLGVRVTIFARGDGLAQLSDPLVLRSAAQALSGELDLRFQTSIAAVAADGDGLLVRSRTAGGLERSERFAYLLAATGRRPNLSGLGLELAQIELDRHGVPLYDERTMQCGTSAIFIAGDANDEKPVLPQAAEQGKIAGDNAGRYPDLRPGLRRTPLSIAFCAPQITVLGASYKQLSDAGEFGIGAVSFEDQGRSRIMLQNRGMLRVYGEFGSGRFIGAEMAGPCAEHIGHLLSWACQARLTVNEMLDMPFYHPVVEEGVRSALRELAACLAQGPRQHG
jgi:dihydrolipoamide dehydrogenase